MKTETQKVLCLVSGGIDSTALINFYKKMNVEVIGLHFQYGQPSSNREKESVHKVAKFYDIHLMEVNLGFALKKREMEFLFRNSLFVFSAASILPDGFNVIALGVHQGVQYYDCSDRFVSDCQNIIDGYHSGLVTLEAPFINFSKKQMYQYCEAEKVPVEITYSCELSNSKPCGTCPSCIDRRYF